MERGRVPSAAQASPGTAPAPPRGAVTARLPAKVERGVDHFAANIAASSRSRTVDDLPRCDGVGDQRFCSRSCGPRRTCSTPTPTRFAPRSLHSPEPVASDRLKKGNYRAAQCRCHHDDEWPHLPEDERRERRRRKREVQPGADGGRPDRIVECREQDARGAALRLRFCRQFWVIAYFPNRASLVAGTDVARARPAIFLRGDCVV